MNRLSTLSVVAIICSIVLFYIAYWQDQPLVSRAEPKELFDDLLAQTKDVTAISIESAQGVVLEARLNDEQWSAVNLSDEARFPLKSALVNQFVASLASADILELKTTDPQLYDRLGVQGLSSGKEASHLVALKTAKRQWQVIVGKASAYRKGTYVRFVNGKTALLLNTIIPLPTDTQGWLENPTIAEQAGAITRISISQDDTVVIKPNEQGSWRGNTGLVDTLRKLDFDSVVPRNSVLLSWFTQSPTRSITLDLVDEQWEVELYENTESEQLWVTFTSDKNRWQEFWAFSVSGAAEAELMQPVNVIASR